MTLDQLSHLAIGPYGALVLALIAVVWLARKLEQAQQATSQAQAMTARQQDLFEEALKMIREDLIPLLRDRPRRL